MNPPTPTTTPLTTPTTTPTTVPIGPGIVSSSGVRNLFNQNVGNLSTLETNDPYTQLVQNTLARSGVTQGIDIANATAAGANKQIAAEQTGHAYTEGVLKANAESGLDRSAPQFAGGLVSQANNSEAIKLSNLQDEENLAIARAKDARDNRDSAALDKELTYIQGVRKEKAAQLAAMQKQKWEEYKFNVTHGSGGVGGNRYNAKNIPSKVYKDLLDDLSGSNTLSQLYTAYPDVDPTFVNALYKSLHPSNDLSSQINGLGLGQ